MPTDPSAWQAAVREGAEAYVNAPDDAGDLLELYLRTAIATLERHGYVLVPKVATPEMIKRTRGAVRKHNEIMRKIGHYESGEGITGREDVLAIEYRAMLAARPSIVPVAQEG